MKALPWILSVAIHLLLLCGVACLVRVPPVYRIASGRNNIEIDLIAAPAKPSPLTPSHPAPAPPSQPPPASAPLPESPAPTPAPAPPHPSVAENKPATPAPAAEAAAASSGKDTVTLHADAGALPTAEPDYLSNPAPVYPDEARRHRQEGVVLLDVTVGEDGRVESLAIATGSGHPLLDQSALKTVREWRFKPATLGGIHLRSRVEIPIRFRLDG